ncbi:MAG TPA: hypothetical protein VD767_01990 [Thermomicrobiales bacterium]|nr:hypothetical protein [Thermomicrobiales bacterium]
MTTSSAEDRSPRAPDHLKVIDMHPVNRAINADGESGSGIWEHLP